MTAAPEVTSSVEVSADPSTAFAVFTEEVECWWLQGPINFHDSSRAFGLRMEPGVGGRIVEVYDDASREGLELARITEWEPGEYVGWESSLDDVEVRVRFEKSAGGTLVTVCAKLRAGGSDSGGTSWVRVTPIWFSRWMKQRDRVSREPEAVARVAVGVHYERPAEAARWLRDVFGFEPVANIPEVEPDKDESNEDEHTWFEFRVGNSAVMVFNRAGNSGETSSPTHTTWVFVEDLDAHLERARSGGARILREIWQHGPRAYDAADLEGNRWTLAQASPRMR